MQDIPLEEIPIPHGDAPHENRLTPPISLQIPRAQLLDVPQSYRYPPVDPNTFIPDNYRTPNVNSLSAPNSVSELQSSVNPVIFAPAQHRDLKSELVSMVPATILRSKKHSQTTNDRDVDIQIDVIKDMKSVNNDNTVPELDELPIMKKPKLLINLKQQQQPDKDYEDFKKELGDLI